MTGHRPGGSFGVHGSAWVQEVCDISDVDAQFQVAVWQFPDVQRIVNILAAGRIHAADGQVPQVLPAHARTCPDQHNLRHISLGNSLAIYGLSNLHCRRYSTHFNEP